MKVKDILETTLVFLGKHELLSTSAFDESVTEELTEAQSKEIGFLVRCFNLVYKEVSGDYLPLMYDEKISFSQGKFELVNLTQNILDIFKLYDDAENNISYKLFPDYIKANTEIANITYSYIPDDLGFEDNVLLFGGKLLPQVLSYGVAREYCLISGDHKEADIWEKRFKDGVFVEMRRKSQIKIKPRRWF